MKRNVKDPEHQICRDYVAGKNCEFCEQLFNDLLNQEGFYPLIKNPPKILSEEDIKEFGREKAIKLVRDELIKPAEGFARTKLLCRKHQSMFRRDNNERSNKGMDIPTDFSLLRIKKSLI